MEIEISSILEQILSGLGVALAAIIAAGIRYLFARIKNDRLRDYGDLLVIYAEKAVKTVAQTQAEALKAASADGKLTDAEKEMLKKSAVDTLKSIAPDAIMKFMEKANSDVDSLLETLIEAAVLDSKGGES